jgi:non-ribosomal peptide synthase protein (TIGR01720 family)
MSLTREEKLALLRARLESQTRVAPVTSLQRQLWFLDRLLPGNPVYNMAGGVRTRGPLDDTALASALADLTQRHEILRTTFEERDGQPVQVIHGRGEVSLPRLDLNDRPDAEHEALAHAVRLGAMPLDLTRGPLWRVELIRIGAGDHLLVTVFHHIISDGWGNSIFARDLAALYATRSGLAGATLPPMSLQLSDYARWEQERLQSNLLDGQIRYWKGHLAGAPPVLALPTDRPRADAQRFRGAKHYFTVDAASTAALEAAARRASATLFMMLLAGYATLLHRRSGQDDLVIATPMINRKRVELEPLIGPLVNTLPLRISLAGRPTFRALVDRVREVQLGAWANPDVPLTRLLSELRVERDPRHHPLFQTLFVLHNTPPAAVQVGPLQLEPVDVDNGTARFDLSLTAVPRPDGALRAWLEYDASLFDAATVARTAEQLVALLRAATERPEAHLDDLAAAAAIPDAARIDTVHGAMPAPEHAPGDRRRDPAPVTDAEQTLAALWREVLQLDEVAPSDNFFAIGGDSIIALQVIARAREHGLKLSAEQFFQHQTLSALARVARPVALRRSSIETGAGPVPLGPIQRWFFDLPLRERDHWNQAVLLELEHPIETDRLEGALAAVVERHAGLRARFQQRGGAWVQELSAPAPRPRVERVALDRDREVAIRTVAGRAQRSLSLADGRLVHGVHFDTGTDHGNALLLVIHHLVVDGVSWRILLDDLARALARPSGPPDQSAPVPAPTSYRDWVERLERHAQTPALRAQARFWIDMPWSRIAPLPRAGAATGLEQDARVATDALDPQTTEGWLKRSGAAYGTRPDELLLAAVARAVGAWAGHELVAIDVEGHGRANLFDDLDLSRTVGWFTSIYPLVLRASPTLPLADAIKAVKELRRRVPDDGLGFLVGRYLGPEDVQAELGRLPAREVCFNFLGQTARLPAGVPFRGSDMDVGPSRGPANPCAYRLMFGAAVRDDRLVLSLTYDGHAYDDATAQGLVARALAELRSMITLCTSAHGQDHTPADFPAAKLSQGQLDTLLRKLGRSSS